MKKNTIIQSLKPKFKWEEWLKRYLVPELLGLFFAYISVIIYNYYDSSPSDVTASFSATWGENLGYYSIIFFKDFKLLNRKHSLISRIVATFKGIIFEFGLAELLDSFIFRPFCIYWGIRLLGLEIGLIVGKIISDITFYIPTIIFYELKKSRAGKS
jgi:hypothetical protein